MLLSAALLTVALQVAEPTVEPLPAARREAFLEAWAAADETRRAHALRELDRLRLPGAPPSAPPSVHALGRAWRALTGGADPSNAAATAVAVLAEGLELCAVPGVFEAGLSGRPLTVQVRSPEARRPAGRVELELVWLPPPGGERAPLRARTSEAWPDAFTPAGFELHVRTPEDARSGTWRLRLELIADGERAAVPALEVECLAPRPDASAGDGRADARERAIARELAAWRGSGLPASAGLTAAALFDERDGRFERLQVQGAGVWVWRPRAELRAVVIVLSPQRAAALAPLCGVRGAAWREAAGAAGFLLVPWRVGRGGSTDDLASLSDALAAFAPGLERAPRVLVARGESARYVALSRAARPPFDAWVLSWSGERAPRLPWPETPTRVLRDGVPVAGAPLAQQTPAHSARPGTGRELLDDLLAPAAVLELLESWEH